MENKVTPPVIELPVQWQNVVVDIESVAPINQFDTNKSYDVANMTAVVALQVPEEKDYRLLLSCDVEAGTRATVRVMSSDDKFDDIIRFNRVSDNSAKDYIPQLDKSGLVAIESTESIKIAYIKKNFKEATIRIPSGLQKLRIHASNKIVANSANPKEFEIVQFAPLLGFTLAGGQVNLALTITFPPSFEGNNIAIDPPVVEPIPGMPVPSDATPPFTGIIGAVQAYAWHWRTDPKVRIKYRYQ